MKDWLLRPRTLKFDLIILPPAIGNTSTAISKLDLDYIPTDPRELRQELVQAKKNFAKLEATRFTALHPKETVLNIVLGKPFALEFYRSFKDKEELLDEAVRIRDGDAILTVS